MSLQIGLFVGTVATGVSFCLEPIELSDTVKELHAGVWNFGAWPSFQTLGHFLWVLSNSMCCLENCCLNKQTCFCYFSGA